MGTQPGKPWSKKKNYPLKKTSEEGPVTRTIPALLRILSTRTYTVSSPRRGWTPSHSVILFCWSPDRVDSLTLCHTLLLISL